jgi:hypothetical protein
VRLAVVSASQPRCSRVTAKVPVNDSATVPHQLHGRIRFRISLDVDVMSLHALGGADDKDRAVCGPHIALRVLFLAFRSVLLAHNEQQVTVLRSGSASELGRG